MIVDALVPVKMAAAAKARLAPLLGPDERQRLVRAMLEDVIAALLGCRHLRRVVVTSPDAEIRALAQRLGAAALSEPGGLGLNGGLAFGLRRLLRDGASGVLIVPADLPAISNADVAAMLLPACSGRVVRAAPSIDGGTGALLLVPPDVIAPAFGGSSFARHQKVATSAGVRFERRHRAGLAADVDYPDDLSTILEGSGAHHTRALIVGGGIAERCLETDKESDAAHRDGRRLAGPARHGRRDAGRPSLASGCISPSVATRSSSNVSRGGAR